jgi:transposase
LRAVYATARSPDKARSLFQRWLGWAKRCRLNPFRRFARTITSHLTGVPSGFEAGKHTGPADARNRALGEARARARDYRRVVEDFIAMANLVAGKLTHLRAPPFAELTVVPDKRSLLSRRT